MFNNCRHKVPVSLLSGLVIFGLALLLWGCGSKKSIDPGGNQALALGNQAPVLSSVSAAPATITLGSSAVLKATASDPDGDPITYFWNPQLGSIIGSGPQVLFSSETCCTGTIRIFVDVRDGRGAKTESHVDVVVQP